MPQITYVTPDDSEFTVDVPLGTTVMEGSVRNNLPGIIAECGGGCSCATCHVHISEEFNAYFDEPSDDEIELLQFSETFCSRSRLACQLIVTEKCDGMRLTIPPGNDG